jgi:hypothetical protein
MTFTRLAPGDLLLIAELPEIQTAIAYIMGRIVSAYFASIPARVNAPRRTKTSGAAACSATTLRIGWVCKPND